MSNEFVEWRTKLDADDVPNTDRLDGSESQRDHYRRLAVVNTLDWNGKWADEERVTEKCERGIFDSVTSRLELTDFQKQRAWNWYQSLPDTFRTAYQMEMVLVVVAAQSGAADGRNYHPNNLTADDGNEFAELCDRLGFSHGLVYKLWMRVKREVDND